LAWKIAQSSEVERVLAAPGSDGMASVAGCFPEVAAGDAAAVEALSRRESIDLIVIGPEDPLAAGLADRLRSAGFAVFGPSAAAARLESSKTFANQFMARHGIPTAASRSFGDLAQARAHVRERGDRCVVKADGLAAGKGVFMCETNEAAERALAEIMQSRRFGDAGASVVIEDWLEGEEVSYYAISDGERVLPLSAAQDYKRALDADQGENTGGMGAYSPVPMFSDELEARVLEKIVHPTIRGMAAEGSPYVGVLYVGLIFDPAGDFNVIEFNVRFGDPETQPLMVRLVSDLAPTLLAAARGRLDERVKLEWKEAAVCVALASGGYPRAYQTGRLIHGLGDLQGDPQLTVFHAGTRRRDSGEFETAGGRVVGLTAGGSSVREAHDRVYAAVSKVHFDDMQLRRDIAARALTRSAR
jgi:phosphoribosylamine--glycine ligase